ncbi:YebC/PmpR family DNA-binding transcriptional regulator, partial [Escherichia coli]|nr:YebC/PmpR family DNA-binding transcriptional regulator [Escherichia coli]
FQSKGQLIIERNEDMDEDEVMMIALDAGAEDFEASEEVFEIITSPEDFGEVREKLEAEGFEFLSAEVTMIPDTTIEIPMERAEGLQKLIDKLEDDDDVQNVYHNADFPEEW